MALKHKIINGIDYTQMDRTTSKQNATDMAAGINYRRGARTAIVRPDGKSFVVYAKTFGHKARSFLDD